MGSACCACAGKCPMGRILPGFGLVCRLPLPVRGNVGSPSPAGWQGAYSYEVILKL